MKKSIDYKKYLSKQLHNDIYKNCGTLPLMRSKVLQIFTYKEILNITEIILVLKHKHNIQCKRENVRYALKSLSEKKILIKIPGSDSWKIINKQCAYYKLLIKFYYDNERRNKDAIRDKRLRLQL